MRPKPGMKLGDLKEAEARNEAGDLKEAETRNEAGH
jgi:hypothetical protein